MDGGEIAVMDAAAGEEAVEAEEAGKVVVATLWVDVGLQAVDSNALWNLRTGPWGHLWTMSSSINCY